MTLTSPAAAICYHLWLRSRWPLAGALAGMLIVSFAAGFVPHEMRAAFLLPAVLIFATVLVILMSIFTYAGGDLSARESGFPRYMLTLPAPVITLVTVPMLFGCLTSALMWVVLVKVVLARIGSGAPVLWPTAASAAVCVWLQAISWIPVWFKMARVLAGVVILTAVIAVGIAGQFFGFPTILLLALYLAIIIAAFLAAAAGVARARRGDGTTPPWELRASPRPRAKRHDLLPFSSPWQSMLWFECRRNLGFSVVLCALSPLAIVTAVQLGNPDHRTGLYAAGVTIQPAMLALGICLATPIFAAVFMNGTIAKIDAWVPHLEIPAFHATRPVATTYMVRMKLLAAAIGVIGCWGAALLVVGVWVFLPHSFDRQHTIAQMFRSRFPSGRISVALAVLIAVVFSSWKVIAESLFVYFYGRKWLMNTIVLVSLGIWGLVPTLGYAFVTHPRWFNVFSHVFPWLAIALVIVRILAFFHILRLLDRHRLVSMSKGLLFASGWLLLAIAIWLAVFLSFPAVHTHAWTLALGVFFFLPAVRVSLAPLMLHLNRHR